MIKNYKNELYKKVITKLKITKTYNYVLFFNYDFYFPPQKKKKN